MSGIVNSTGAKSGVIGTTVAAGLTEETGTFTPTLNVHGGDSITSAGQYIKLGNLVLITLHHIIGGSASGSTACVSMGGMPFTKKTGSSKTIVVFGYNDGVTGDADRIKFKLEADATSGLILSNHNTDVLQANRLPVGAELYLTFTYQCNTP